MVIDINPSGVLRSADAVDAAGRQAGRGDVPAVSGNSGFTTSRAISQFAAEMHRTTVTAATDTGTTADKLVASATLMRRIDDDVAGAARTLWSRVPTGSPGGGPS